MSDDSTTVGSKPWASPYVEKIGTKSALSPLIWLAAVLVPATVVAAGFDKELRNVFLWFTGLDILVILAAYLYFMLRKPEMLGSEDHQYRTQLMGDERRSSITVIDATPTANNRLSDAKGGTRDLAKL
jgi:hypothetical protein